MGYSGDMSCIPSMNRKDAAEYVKGKPLPHSSPAWTKSKQRRIDAFARDVDASRRAVAASHPHCARHLLLSLMMDENLHTRRMAVQNPTMTRAMLRLALKDDDFGIRAYARMRLKEEK